ncbi:hypothetical protein HRbin30_00753 [bacterium HR30]|nr:hypothetical protein HRbin30_00753 [bacterium HR30]
MAKRRSQTGAAKKRSATWVALSAVFTIALCLRLVYLHSIQNSPSALVLQTNALRYHTWARAILDGNPPVPPFDQPPAYAYFVAAVYRLFGADPSSVRVAQAVLDAIGCTLLAALAAQRGVPIGVAWATGLLAAMYGPLIFFTGEILPATASLLLLGLAAFAGSRKHWHVAGVLWLAATLFRTEFLLPFVAYVTWVFFGGLRLPARQLATWVILGWLIATTVVSAAAGRIVPYTTGFGLNLWLGNNPHADGVDPFPPVPLRAALERARAASGNDPVKLERWFLGQAFAFWREYPGEALRLLWKKFRWTLVDRELPNTGDVAWQQSHSWLFRLPLFPLSFGVVLCLAAAGFATGFGRQCWKGDFIPLVIVAACTLVTCSVFFTNGRFRLPLAPLLLVSAGHFLAALTANGVRRHLRQHPLALTASVAVALWLAFANPFQVRKYFVPALLTNAGVAERLAGELQVAIRLLERAVAATREDDLAWSHLALAREQIGDLVGAAHAYLDGLTFASYSQDLRQLAREFCVRHGLKPQWIDEWIENSSLTERQALRTQIVETIRKATGTKHSTEQWN